MAALRVLARNVVGAVSRRGFHVAAVTRADQVGPDPLDHATGLEKYELLAKQAGTKLLFRPFELIFVLFQGTLTHFS